MDKYVLLDFCETVADFQTFDAYLAFALEEKRPWLYKIYRLKWFGFILDKLSAVLGLLKMTVYLRKIFLTACTLGMKEEVLRHCGRKFYEQVVEKHLINDTLELIEKFYSKNMKIIIISGGSKFYIDCFARKYNIKHVITAEMLCYKNRSMGILASECLGANKIKMLDCYMRRNGLDGEYVYAVTDSKSDMPIIKRAKKAIVISHGQHKTWVDDSMEEIIWE